MILYKKSMASNAKERPSQLINFSIDEVSNPKLRAQRIMRKYYKEKKKQEKLLNKQLSATTTSKGGIKYGSST